MSGMTLRPTEDIRRWSPFRGPAWRWDLALEHLQSGTDPESWEDPAVRESFQFLKARGAVETDDLKNAVVKRWPILSKAYAIHSVAGPMRDEIQARLLCEPPEVIAAKTDHPAEVVAEYARIFFDVLGSLQARDWLLEHAVRAHSFAMPPTEGECWRYLALAGGPFVLDLLVADYFGRSEPHYPDRHRDAERARFLVRDYASLMQTSRWADPEIVEVHCRLYREDVRSGRRKPDPEMALHLKFLRLAAKLPRCREIERSLPKVSSRRKRARKGNSKDQQPQTKLNMTPAIPGIAAGRTCEHGVYRDCLVPAADQFVQLGV